jgi:hypothetical protein
MGFLLLWINKGDAGSSVRLICKLTELQTEDYGDEIIMWVIVV